MKIVVTTSSDSNVFPYTFNSATSWHVDDLGRLHIRKATGNLATFNVGSWNSVSEEV